MRAIRAKCLDCCCFSAKEVALCPALDCPLHLFRMGKRPSTGNKPINESNTEKNAPARGCER